MSRRREAGLVIGTRGSDLAIKQAEEVKYSIIEHFPEFQESDIVLKKITTTGDKILDRSLNKIGGKGLFTKEIEEALLRGDIDMAVHSMKDVPAKSLGELTISAILKREDPRDAFISNKYQNLNDLPVGATVGTSSLRRQAILLDIRPDLKVVFMRGNINSRLRKLDAGEADAIILAVCGLKRIGQVSRIKEYLPCELMLPAIGQGAIGVEIRKGNDFVAEVLNKINHTKTEIAISSERIFMLGVDGDCRTPMAAHAEIANEEIRLRSLILFPDGSSKYAAEISGHINDYELLANKIVDDTKINAREILAYIKDNL